jgi:transcriptional regulator with XRE-family HTH domain
MALGAVIKRQRKLRGLSAVQAAREAEISPAYLSKLEGDSVRNPSPHILHSLSGVLGLPYGELMKLAGYLVPDGRDEPDHQQLNAAFFADLNEDERNELLRYLTWYRERQRSG